jgi:hypothetical protein
VTSERRRLGSPVAEALASHEPVLSNDSWRFGCFRRAAAREVAAEWSGRVSAAKLGVDEAQSAGIQTMHIEVVSVHFPKAAGCSLRRALEEAFGPDGLFLDYADDPVDPCSSFSLDPEGCSRRTRKQRLPESVRVVHGHFHPAKYAFLHESKWITFLRHPIDNFLSIYFFWKTVTESHALFNYCRDRQLSVLELARVPALRYLFSRTYFGGVDMRLFDFIGFTDSYAEDMATLARQWEIPVREFRENANTYSSYGEEAKAIRADLNLMMELRDCLAEDIAFYEAVRASRRPQRP